MKFYTRTQQPSPTRELVGSGAYQSGVEITDETCGDLGWTAVVMPERPESPVQAVATLVDGAWVGSWEEQPSVDAAQLERSQDVRRTRDGLLKACDWTQLPDATVDKQAWAAYRQALRDVPAQEGFPLSVQWPVEPQ